MFYVPQKTTFPRQKLSLKFISKLENHLKINKTPENSENITRNTSLRKRFKTVTEDIDKTQKVSLPCRVKKSMQAVALPVIVDRKFLLKGKIAGLQKEREKVKDKDKETSLSSGKKIDSLERTGRISQKYSRKLKIQKQNNQKDYFELQPWQIDLNEYY